MAIIYRLVRDERKNSPYKGKYFARAVNLGTIETDELARLIERNCSVKRSDVLAVLAELSDVIAQKLADSHRVRLADPTQYNNTYITGLHLCFKPEKELRLTDADVQPLPP